MVLVILLSTDIENIIFYTENTFLTDWIYEIILKDSKSLTYLRLMLRLV